MFFPFFSHINNTSILVVDLLVSIRLVGSEGFECSLNPVVDTFRSCRNFE